MDELNLFHSLIEPMFQILSEGSSKLDPKNPLLAMHELGEPTT